MQRPRDATVADIREAYLEGWKLGLKAMAIYRDGSKGSQPVSTKSETDTKADAEAAKLASLGVPPPPIAVAAPAPPRPCRRRLAGFRRQPRRARLPHTRQSLTHKFDIQGHEGYVTVGFYPDGRPGEVFITMAKEGSTIGGLMDVLGTSISMGLQYGVPLDVFVNKFAHSRFEPAGFTKNPDIPIAKSVTDYIFRWLGMEFIPGYREANAPQRPADEAPEEPKPVVKVNGHRTATIADLEHTEAVLNQATPPAPLPPRRSGHPRDRRPGEARRAVRPLPERRPRLRQLRGPDRPLRDLLPLLQLRQQHGLLLILRGWISEIRGPRFRVTTPAPGPAPFRSREQVGDGKPADLAVPR